MAPQKTTNFDVYRQLAVAKHYAAMASLFPQEERALEAIAARCRGLPLMDLGCGGGRTTPALLSLSQDYIGIDYSPEMINACRARFPGTRFEVGDACNLAMYPASHFGLVLFSFNGIDYLPHLGRIEALRQVHRVLRPNGVFLFSSHNALFSERHQKSLLRRLAGWAKDYLVDVLYGARGPHQLVRPRRGGYRAELLPISGQRLLTYYIRSDEQSRQLWDAGFTPEATYDGTSDSITDSTKERTPSPWIYYLATKEGGSEI